MDQPPAPDYRARAAAGMAALHQWYLPGAGRWATTGWWNAANALTAVIRYTRHTGDWSYQGVIKATFTAARLEHPDFINEYFDDSLWWALAWVSAYDLTGDGEYLSAAQAIFGWVVGGWDGTCGGGLWWSQDRDYKNAITNELFLTLAALLHQRAPVGQEYLDWALREWRWLSESGMIGPSGLVNDGLTSGCANNQGITWTYNQGVILGGLVALHQITGDSGYLRQAEATANAALSALTTPRGVLAEPCEPHRCDEDQTQFKGIFVRYLHELAAHSRDPAYPALIRACANSAWDNARNAANQFGACWSGPFDKPDASRQSSAVEALIAAAALTPARTR